MQSVSNISDLEITTTRFFNYSREAVFTAWANAQQLAQWWGPKDFTNTIHEFDFKAGGKWKFTMHGPDGTDYANENHFIDIVTPEQIVFRHLEPVHVFTGTAVFEKAGDSTKLIFRMKFESADEFEKVKGFIAVANEENFDRLENLLNNNK